MLTHPVQYFSPWFRYIHAHAPSIALTVVYATRLTPTQQGAGFGLAFEWDVPLLDGYRSRVVQQAHPGDALADASGAIDAPDIGRVIAETDPGAVLIPGWHARVYGRALAECRARKIPTLYRGDTNLLTTHRGLGRLAWRARTRRRLEKFDAYLAVGTRSRQLFAEFGAWSNQVFDSPHAVDNGYFDRHAAPHQTPAGRRALRRQFGLSDEEFVVLFAGKLEEKKRPLDAVRAAARSSATLLVVGSGPLSTQIEEEAARTGARVRMAGFLNQSRIAEAYAAADCLVLPSDRRETWGLVVNEAMATGLPCVVSEDCGCAPDLVDDETGATYPVGDVTALASAIERVRARDRSGGAYSSACRARVRTFSFEHATAGVSDACAALARRPAQVASPRVVLGAGRLVIAGGKERMSFEIARVIVDGGGAVHTLVNRWDSSRIRALAERAGATWSTIYHQHPLTRRTANPITIAKMLFDVLMNSRDLLRAIDRLDATHVFMPDFTEVVRCAPALLWVRLSGRVRVVSRLANAPDRTPFYRFLWRCVIGPLNTELVANSKFTEGELLSTGVPSRKVRQIYNMVPARGAATVETPPPSADFVYVGQIVPAKGLSQLLDAMALIRSEFPSSTLNIVGDMEGWVAPQQRGYREAVRARAEQPDLAGRIRFLGWREDVAAVIRAARVHCCPSMPEQREAFGNVVVEAKAAGRPSIVTPIGALPELVAHRDNGWICTDTSADAIADGMRFFLNDHESWRAACDAAAASAQAFSQSTFDDGWADVFGAGVAHGI